MKVEERQPSRAGAPRGGLAAGRRVTRRWMLGALGAAAPAAGLATACTAGSAAPAPQALRGRVEIWFTAFRFDEGVGGGIVEEVRRQYPNLDVVASAVTGDRVEKLKVAAAADSAPDVGEAGAWQMQEFGASGIAAPVDQYLKTSRVVKQADIWPTLLYDLTWKGQQYGMPFGPDIAVMSGPGRLPPLGGAGPRPAGADLGPAGAARRPAVPARPASPGLPPPPGVRAARGRCSCWPSPSSAASC